ncbi:hypothetical protein [Limnobacter alexandrii]|jgi:hypothetical protein|uniref:hypothetical protein n=1 Tax=Limnobacter alexandrii TaxID=2570352 RepID=UPI0011092FD3|nr:hypothetical protein [Limnobacter alexandrii]
MSQCCSGKVIGLVAVAALCMIKPARAIDNVVQRLSNPEIHCGHQPTLDLFNGVVNALSESQSTAAALTLRREDRRLELLIHFMPGQREIPDNCLPKLRALNEATKTGRSGPILIRSSTQTGGSAELDLAMASQRLDSVQNYFRENRLARRAFVLELHPDTSNPLFGDAVSLPNMVEIYSSPAN